MRPLIARCLILVLLPMFGLPAAAEKKSEYGDIIILTPEYEKITTPRSNDNDDDDRYYHHDHRHHYHYDSPRYPPPYSSYRRSSGSRITGPAGHVYLGVAVGESEFDYNDIADGDASKFHFGYRPSNSHLGYEISFYDSGNSEVTSLSGIDLRVDSLNLLLSYNTSRAQKSPLNFFAQGGIYFADTTLTGPFDSVSENSNGFMLSAGVEVMLNPNFGLRAEIYRLDRVEDFANDESLNFFTLGGQFVF